MVPEIKHTDNTDKNNLFDTCYQLINIFIHIVHNLLLKMKLIALINFIHFYVPPLVRV